MNNKPHCPSCDSVDTVGYWDKVDAEDVTSVILKRVYPDARRCIDCDFVWHPNRLRQLINLASLTKEGA